MSGDKVIVGTRGDKFHASCSECGWESIGFSDPELAEGAATGHSCEDEGDSDEAPESIHPALLEARRDGMIAGMSMALDFFGVPDGAPVAEALYDWGHQHLGDEEYAP